METSEGARYPCVRGSDKQPHLSRADLPADLPPFHPFSSLPFSSLPFPYPTPLALSLSLLFFSPLFLSRLFSPSLASPVRYWQPSQPKRQPTKNPGPWRLLISSLGVCCLRVEKTFSILVFEAKTKREARLPSFKKTYRQNSWNWNEFWKIPGDWDSLEDIDKMFTDRPV